MPAPVTVLAAGMFAAVVVGTTVAPAPPDLNERCSYPAANEVRCPIQAGTFRYRLLSRTAQYLHLVNEAATPVEIETVAGSEAQPRAPFREYCVSLDVFATGQERAGHGEVGCRTKHDGAPLPPIAFGPGRGLRVPPGAGLYVSSSPYETEPWFDVEVTAATGEGGLLSWRLPHHDRTIKCDARPQDTDGDSWRNSTGRALRTRGALVYAESGTASAITKVGPACLAIRDPAGRTRYATCKGLDQAGPVPFEEVIAPDESVAAYASNTCAPGGVWDWALYLFLEAP